MLCDVILFEKRSEYTRDQILYLQKDIVKHFPRRLYNDLWGKDKPGCYIGL